MSRTIAVRQSARPRTSRGLTAYALSHGELQDGRCRTRDDRIDVTPDVQRRGLAQSRAAAAATSCSRSQATAAADWHRSALPSELCFRDSVIGIVSRRASDSTPSSCTTSCTRRASRTRLQATGATARASGEHQRRATFANRAVPVPPLDEQAANRGSSSTHFAPKTAAPRVDLPSASSPPSTS